MNSNKILKMDQEKQKSRGEQHWQQRYGKQHINTKNSRGNDHIMAFPHLKKISVIYVKSSPLTRSLSFDESDEE